MKVSVFLKALLLAILVCGISVPATLAQNDESPSGRKVVNRVNPVYPALARTMNLSGTVRLEVLVQPNGSVKTIQIKGGSPVLAQSAENAVRVWKWDKAEHETTEVVEIHFNP